METDQIATTLGLVAMALGSRTTTPTATVRSRPRPPSMLAVSGSTLPRRSNSTDQPDAPVGGGGALAVSGGDDLTGMLTSLGRTDFVRKYSRRSVPTVVSTNPAGSTSGSLMATSPTKEHDGGGGVTDVRTSYSTGNHRIGTIHGGPGGGGEAASPPTPTHRSEMTSPLSIWNRAAHVSPATTVGTALAEDDRRSRQSDAAAESAGGGHPRHSINFKSDAEPTPIEFRADAGAGSRAPVKVNLSRSESDSSSVRSFRLRLLRPTVEMGSGGGHAPLTSQTPEEAATTSAGGPTMTRPRWPAAAAGYRHVEPAADEERDAGGSFETDDEGVGAVDIDGPSFKDTYLSVTTSSGPPGNNSSEIPKHHHHYQYHQQQHQQRVVPPLPMPPAARFHHEPTMTTTTMSGLCSTTAECGEATGGWSSAQGSNSVGLGSNGSGSSTDDTVKSSHHQPVVAVAGNVIFDGSSASSTTHVDSTASSPFADAHLVRKNSKTGKPKSRSDPSGESGNDKSKSPGGVDIPSIVYGAVSAAAAAASLHAQSSPVLCGDPDGRASTIDCRATASLEATRFPFVGSDGSGGINVNNNGDSTSSLSDRERDSRSQSDELSVGVGGGRLAFADQPPPGTTTKSASMREVPVRVVLKSDDSFESGGDSSSTAAAPASASAATMAVKPPRPKAMKRRPRAPQSPTSASTTMPGAPVVVETPATPVPSSTTTPSSLVRKVFSRDRNKDGGKQQLAASAASANPDAAAAAVGGGVESIPASFSASSLTLPLQKRSSLLRSHSSAGAETTSAAGGGSTRPRTKDASGPNDVTSTGGALSVAVRRRSPGANEIPDLSSVIVGSGGSTVAPSSSVPELHCADTSGLPAATTTVVSGTPARVRVRAVTSGSVTASVRSGPGGGLHPLGPTSHEQLMSRSALSLFEGFGETMVCHPCIITNVYI